MKEHSKLLYYEWMTLYILSSIIGYITLRAILHDEGYNIPLEPHDGTALTLVITLKGAVRYPGRYQVPYGSTVGELIGEAEAMNRAKLQRCDLDEKLTKSKTIRVG